MHDQHHSGCICGEDAYSDGFHEETSRKAEVSLQVLRGREDDALRVCADELRTLEQGTRTKMAPSRLSAIEKFGFFVSVATLLSCSATAFGQDKGSPSKPRRATLQQQKMCDEQAKKKFHEDNPHPNETTGYTSHYDPQVNVCYILVHYVEASKNGVSVSDDVYDAFEGREYAAYIWINNEG